MTISGALTSKFPSLILSSALPVPLPIDARPERLTSELIVVIAVVGYFMLPDVPGRKRSKTENIFSLPFRSCKSELWP